MPQLQQPLSDDGTPAYSGAKLVIKYGYNLGSILGRCSVSGIAKRCGASSADITKNANGTRSAGQH